MLKLLYHCLYKTTASTCTFYVNRRSYERPLQPRSSPIFSPKSVFSALLHSVSPLMVKPNASRLQYSEVLWGQPIRIEQCLDKLIVSLLEIYQWLSLSISFWSITMVALTFFVLISLNFIEYCLCRVVF